MLSLASLHWASERNLRVTGAEFMDGCRCIPRTTRGGTPLPSHSCSRNRCAPRRAGSALMRPRQHAQVHQVVSRGCSSLSRHQHHHGHPPAVVLLRHPRSGDTPGCPRSSPQLSTYWQGAPRASIPRRRRPPRPRNSPPARLAPVIVSSALHRLPTHVLLPSRHHPFPSSPVVSAPLCHLSHLGNAI